MHRRMDIDLGNRAALTWDRIEWTLVVTKLDKLTSVQSNTQLDNRSKPKVLHDESQRLILFIRHLFI